MWENLADFERFVSEVKNFVPERDLESVHLNDSGTNLDFVLVHFHEVLILPTIQDGVWILRIGFERGFSNFHVVSTKPSRDSTTQSHWSALCSKIAAECQHLHEVLILPTIKL